MTAKRTSQPKQPVDYALIPLYNSSYVQFIHRTHPRPSDDLGHHDLYYLRLGRGHDAGPKADFQRGLSMGVQLSKRPLGERHQSIWE